MMEKPEMLKEKHLEYLDDLRENFRATAYLLDMYDDLTEEEAVKIEAYWMKTFSDRHAA